MKDKQGAGLPQIFYHEGHLAAKFNHETHETHESLAASTGGADILVPRTKRFRDWKVPAPLLGWI